MTNLEKEALLSCVKRLNKLANLENANFHADKEKDEEIKKSIKPYMMWFESVAFSLEDIIKASEETGFIKRECLEKIIENNM